MDENITPEKLGEDYMFLNAVVQEPVMAYVHRVRPVSSECHNIAAGNQGNSCSAIALNKAAS